MLCLCDFKYTNNCARNNLQTQLDVFVQAARMNEKSTPRIPSFFSTWYLNHSEFDFMFHFISQFGKYTMMKNKNYGETSVEKHKKEENKNLNLC